MVAETGFQLSLHLLGNKSDVFPTVFQSKTYDLLSQYYGHICIFTDGSKIREALGAIAIMKSRLS